MDICVTLFLEIKRKKKFVHQVREGWGWGWRVGGGVLVYFHYFRNELNKVVSVFDKSNKNILWIKIGKNSLNNKSNT